MTTNGPRAIVLMLPGLMLGFPGHLHGLSVLQPPPVRVRITLSEFKFVPNTLMLTEGKPVTLVLTNAGQIEHTLASSYLTSQKLETTGESSEGETDRRWKFIGVGPGRTAEVAFTPKGRGSFAFICGVEGHAEAGMNGTLTVLPP